MVLELILAHFATCGTVSSLEFIQLECLSDLSGIVIIPLAKHLKATGSWLSYQEPVAFSFS